MNTLIKHKDFIIATAKGLISPDKSNDTLNEILAAYNEIDSTAEVLAECSTCRNPYEKTFKIILAYCDSNHWGVIENAKIVMDAKKPKIK